MGPVDSKGIDKPERNTQFTKERIRSIASGILHTLILMEDGSVYSCGDNSYGQCGHDSSLVPLLIDAIKSHVKMVSCGDHFNLALTVDGEILGWGDNREGQLAQKHDKHPQIKSPSPIALPSKRTVVQVACGAHHSLAMTEDGQVYSWGKNTHCQLGYYTSDPRVVKPRCISYLTSVPVTRLAAGGRHSVALTVCGNALAWGSNEFGQLGLGHFNDKRTPTHLDITNTHQVACGQDHTVFLSKGGSVSTCGSNRYGQLGRGEKGYHYSLPAIIMSIAFTSPIGQVACGKYHTVLLEKYHGQLISFGRCHKGQVGINQFTEYIHMPASPFVFLTPPDPDSLTETSTIAKGLYAGGDRSFATIIRPGEHPHPINYDNYDPSISPHFLSINDINQMAHVSPNTKTFTKTINTLKMVFSSPSCINGSFLLSNDGDDKLHSQIDIEQLLEAFKLLRDQISPHYNINELIEHCFIHGLLPNVPEPMPSEECLRLFVVIMTYLVLLDYPDSITLLVNFVKVFLYIAHGSRSRVADWLFNESKDTIVSWIEVYRVPIRHLVVMGRKKIDTGEYIRTEDNTNLVELTDEQTWALQEGIKIMRWIYEHNRKRHEIIPYQKFYIDEVTQCCDLKEDYVAFRANRIDRVLFMRYSFVLNIAAKGDLIISEGRWRMMEAVAEAHHRNLFSMFARQGIRDFSPMACMLHVRRDHLMQDAISGLLSHNPHDLLKPLKVRFEGEEGVDDGGVQKEFFMLLIQEILNPSYGMFYEEEESKLIWFREQFMPLEKGDCQYFNLIGMICGLVIYNGVVADLPFPPVLYKKILTESGLDPPNLADLRALKPSVGSHLQALLDYKGDNEGFTSKFGEITFEITRQNYGQAKTIPLKPSGDKTLVTNQNKKEYVKLYVDYELIECIKEQFDAFNQGFTRVCDTTSDVFKTLHPEELMALVTGSSHYDFELIHKYTYYVNGYNSDHPTIKHFWTIVKNFSAEQKKKLLVFWTGSNRIPVALQNMRVQLIACIIHMPLLTAAYSEDGRRGRLPEAASCSHLQ
jgi:E3 ubiquitin-protein ligase HERC4